MALNLTIGQLVVVVISAIMIVVGIFLTLKISEIKEVLPSLPLPEKNIRVEVEPESSQQGTLFLITAEYFDEREQQDLGLRIEKENYSELLNLYDNGLHYDGEVKDGVYAGFFDSKGKPLGKYEIKNEKDETVASFVVHEQGCEIIEGASGNDKINFIILPSGYDDYGEFKKDAKKLITEKNSLLEVEPFKSHREQFAFFIVNTSRDLKCEIGCKNVSTIVCCDNKVVLEEASRCSYDSILVLVKSKKLCGSSSSYAKICSENSDANLILLHEAGHSFADLADEYVYEDYFGDYSIGEIEGINCAEEGCEKWGNITEGCYKGCTYSNLYRSVEKNSIMYDLYPEYNDVCKNYIENLIENYVKNKETVEKALPKKSYFVNLNYDNGEIEIKNVFLKPVNSWAEHRKSDYSVELKDKEEKSIFNSSLYVPDKIYPIPPFGKIIFEREFDFSLILPYFFEAKDLVIYRGDRAVAHTSLAVFSEVCGNKICEGTENHLSCAVDCEIEDRFCETSRCDPDCESQRNCERNRKIMLWFSIFLILGALVLIVIFLSRKK